MPSDGLEQIQSFGSSLVDNPFLTGIKEGFARHTLSAMPRRPETADLHCSEGVGLPLFLCGLCGVRQYAWFEKLLTPLAKGCRRAGIRSPGFGSIESLIIGAPHVEGTLGHRL